MRILAIDPGPEMSAWCSMLYGKPTAWRKEVNALVLAKVRTEPVDSLLAVEMVQSFGMPVGREVFETVYWSGRFVEAWNSRGGDHQLVYRKSVKLALCGSLQAKDANIRQALIDRFGGKEKAIGRKATPGPLYGLAGDEWSALAVAVTASEIFAPNALQPIREAA